MNAQSLDSPDGRNVAHLPRTIRAIRAALPDDKRAQFVLELDDSEAGSLVNVVERWHTRALVWSNPKAMAKLAAGDAGRLTFVPIEQVFPGFPGTDR